MRRLLCLLLIPSVIALQCLGARWNCLSFSRQTKTTRTAIFATRYGPPVEGHNDIMDEDDSERDKKAQESASQREFSRIINEILQSQDPQHIPSILTRELHLILKLTEEGGPKMVEAIVDQTEEDQGKEAAELVSETADMILSFAEDFVQEASKIEEQHKKLLGKIIRVMADKDTSAREREEQLDTLMRTEKDNFSGGFLRHIDSECERIANAKSVSPESMRMLETIRVVQARVLEEVGTDLGEAAQVLGQLIGYPSSSERIAVLEAGLMVRGADFAMDMSALTEEALDGFQRVPGGADPGLVKCIEEIHNRLKLFISTDASFQ